MHHACHISSGTTGHLIEAVNALAIMMLADQPRYWLMNSNLTRSMIRYVVLDWYKWRYVESLWPGYWQSGTIGSEWRTAIWLCHRSCKYTGINEATLNLYMTRLLTIRNHWSLLLLSCRLHLKLQLAWYPLNVKQAVQKLLMPVVRQILQHL